MERCESLWLSKLLICERPGKRSFRFWREGSGYDRMINSPATLQKVLKYLHDNPARRQLCAGAGDWKWSSWRHYHCPEFDDPDLPSIHGLPDD